MATSWSSVSKASTSWTEYTYWGTFAALAFGSGLFGGFGTPSWSAVSKQTTSWSAVTQDA